MTFALFLVLKVNEKPFCLLAPTHPSAKANWQRETATDTRAHASQTTHGANQALVKTEQTRDLCKQPANKRAGRKEANSFEGYDFYGLNRFKAARTARPKGR